MGGDVLLSCLMARGSRTVVAETRGAARGRRVVRGREAEGQVHPPAPADSQVRIIP